jgi:hypothetical protein
VEKIIGRQGTTDIKALDVVTVPLVQEVELFSRLNALGNHLDAQLVR